MRRLLIIVTLIAAVTLSGCFIEGGEGGTLDFEGNIDVSDAGFTMVGHLEFDGQALTRDTYRDISIELYDRNGTIQHKEHLGDLHNPNEELEVSISRSMIPYYIIIDSPDIWDEKTGVPFYVRADDRELGYELHRVNRRSDLPIKPEG